jgi:hypothetical protein
MLYLILQPLIRQLIEYCVLCFFCFYHTWITFLFLFISVTCLFIIFRTSMFVSTLWRWLNNLIWLVRVRDLWLRIWIVKLYLRGFRFFDVVKGFLFKGLTHVMFTIWRSWWL